MIAIFDEDGGGDVDFQEFVSGLSAFSSKGNKEEKLRFAFKVYDIDRDGYISNGELFIVLKMMVGSNLKDQQLQQVSTPRQAGRQAAWACCDYTAICGCVARDGLCEGGRGDGGLCAVADADVWVWADSGQDDHGGRSGS